MNSSPFSPESYADLAPVSATPEDTLREMLRISGRGYTVVRTSFCQHPRANGERASSLAPLVAGRKKLPLQLYLLALTIHPWAAKQEQALPGLVWARALSNGGRVARPSDISAAWRVLEDARLIERTRLAHGVRVTPCLEDGSGTPYTPPGRHYFTLPPTFWLDGTFDKLSISGLAMLLIVLSQTNSANHSEVWLSNENAPTWWGISARTARAGLEQLKKLGIVRQHQRATVAPLLSSGRVIKAYYEPLGDYSTASRLAMQERASRDRATRLTGSATAAS